MTNKAIRAAAREINMEAVEFSKASGSRHLDEEKAAAIIQRCVDEAIAETKATLADLVDACDEINSLSEVGAYSRDAAENYHSILTKAKKSMEEVESE